MRKMLVRKLRVCLGTEKGSFLGLVIFSRVKL
jgi:hypothetical protein